MAVVRAPFRRRSVWTRDTVIAGAAAGATGGLLMALWAMGQAGIAGGSMAYPLQLVAATFLGKAAVAGGGASFALGLALHMLVASGLGVLFAAAMEARPGRAATTPVASILYAMAILLVMSGFFLPLANRTLEGRVLEAPGSWLLMHGLYAVGLTLTPVVHRALGARAGGGAVVIPLRRPPRRLVARA